MLLALGATRPTLSNEVVLTIPDLADNGAVVPVGISTALQDVRRLVLLVEKNPTMLVAVFEISVALEPDVALRIKMAESSQVYAVAMLADGRVLYACQGCAGDARQLRRLTRKSKDNPAASAPPPRASVPWCAF